MSIPRASITHPISVTMLMLAMTLIGIVGLLTLNVDLMPNTDIPIAVVRASYEGVDPSEIETIVTQKIEDQVKSVEDIDKITSYSSEGSAQIVVEFNYGNDIDLSAVDLRAKVDIAKRTLPDDMDDIITSKVDINAMPILRIAVSGDMNPAELRRVAENEIKPSFQQISGVATVDVSGGREREIRIKVMPEKLMALGLTIDDVSTAIAKDNTNTSLGNMTEGGFKYLLRSDGRMTSPAQLGTIIIKNIDGRPVYISEIATIHDDYKDISSVSRMNGNSAITLAIKKVTEANPVNISDEVQKLIPQIEEKYRGKVKLSIGRDQTTFIRETINMVRDNALMGGLLAAIILFLFLQNYRSTIIVSFSIPIALLTTFGMLMLKEDVTLNMMSLGGLALGIGMMIDNAIVVIENVYRFYTENPDGDKKELAAKATEEVFMPVIASTATTVAAFLPIGFVPEMVGDIFFSMSLSIIFALVASLVVSVTLVPMLCSRFLKLDSLFLETIIVRMYKALWNWIKANKVKSGAALAAMFAVPAAGFYFGLKNAAVSKILGFAPWIGETIRPGTDSLIFSVVLLLTVALLPLIAAVILTLANQFFFKLAFPLFNKMLDVTKKIYARSLKFLLERWYMRLGYIILIIAMLGLTLKFQPSFSFFPSMDRGAVSVAFETPAGTSVEQTDLITQQIEKIFINVEEVEKIVSTSSVGEGSVDLTLVSSSKRTKKTEDVVREHRAEVEAIPGIKSLDFKEQQMGRPSSGKSIQIEVMGESFDVIESLCMDIYNRIKDVEGLVDLESGVEGGRPEYRLVFDREKIRDMGLNLVDIAARARTYIYGSVAGQYRENNDEYDIRVEAEDLSKDKISRIKDLEIALGDGKFIKLSQIAEFKPASGYSTIQRKNCARCVIVQGNPDNRSIGAIQSDIEARIADIEIPAGYIINFGGENEDMQKSFKYLALAMIAAVFLVYMIMASQFESVIYPFIIMFTLPLSYIGVIGGFNLMGFSFTVTAMIGIIMLAGIAVNNGILLIEYILQRRQELNEGDVEASVAAGDLRFRPILMTTFTTFLGMLPLALGIGSGADFYQPLAVAVASGLMVSTLLTLSFVPTLYVTLDRIMAWFGSFFSVFTKV